MHRLIYELAKLPVVIQDVFGRCSYVGEQNDGRSENRSLRPGIATNVFTMIFIEPSSIAKGMYRGEEALAVLALLAIIFLCTTVVILVPVCLEEISTSIGSPIFPKWEYAGYANSI